MQGLIRDVERVRQADKRKERMRMSKEIRRRGMEGREREKGGAVMNEKREKNQVREG